MVRKRKGREEAREGKKKGTGSEGKEMESRKESVGCFEKSE